MKLNPTEIVLADRSRTNGQGGSCPITASAILKFSLVVGGACVFSQAGAAPDQQPPTAPTGLTAVATSSSQVALSWNASTDNVGVTAYLLERCQGATCTTFTQVASTSATSYTNTGLSGSTTYRYRVRARDKANNRSAYSNIASATTPQPPDTQAPSTPSNLTATATSNTQINLRWNASTDNVSVVGYSVERCEGAACSNFLQVSEVPGTAFNDMGLTTNSTYRYRVRAKDAVPNYSAYSAIVTTTVSVTEVECD
jgi:chitodextrinase